jgi:hypothetical protein
MRTATTKEIDGKKEITSLSIALTGRDGPASPVLRTSSFPLVHTELVTGFVATVSLDILPRVCRNSLGNRPGSLLVAILGTRDFDVGEVDVDTILLNGAAPLDFTFKDVATPLDCADGRPDGFIDLLMRFEGPQVFQTLGPVSEGDVIIVELEGRLQTAEEIRGDDVVVVISGSATQDSDGDDVPNDEDECPNSDLNVTVVIGDNDSGVPNQLTDIAGCTIIDLIRQLPGTVANQDEFLDVTPVTEVLVAEGLITVEEAEAIEDTASIPDFLFPVEEGVSPNDRRNRR